MAPTRFPSQLLFAFRNDTPSLHLAEEPTQPDALPLHFYRFALEEPLGRRLSLTASALHIQPGELFARSVQDLDTYLGVPRSMVQDLDAHAQKLGLKDRREFLRYLVGQRYDRIVREQKAASGSRR